MEQGNFTPLLAATDWNAEWMELQKSRKKADCAEFWNKKSVSYGGKDAHSTYADDFLGLLDAQPGEVVLDMGCGNGALALPLAQRGHTVLACDFSEGMLGRLTAEAEAKGLADHISPTLMSWQDDWAAHGITPKSVDLALASRSIATSNLKDSLLRLNSVARRKACITLTTSISPRADERLLTQLGLQNALGRDYLYAFNILAQEGLKPSVNYIENAKDDSFDSFEDAYEALSRMVADATVGLGEDQQENALNRLQRWLEDDLVEFQQDGQTRVRLSQPRIVTWAFISWNTR